MVGYWNYYSADFGSPPTLLGQDFIGESRTRLLALGCSPEQVESLTASGYVALKDWDVLIDRFHGGRLASVDGTTRFRLDLASVRDILCGAAPEERDFPVFEAESCDQLRAILQKFKADSGTRLVFRGQNCHHRLKRALPNPWLRHADLGETSLMPSVWRTVLERHPQCLGDFVPWGLFDWSHVLYTQFDIPAIDAAIEASGMYPGMMNPTAMIDHPDPLVSRFGAFRQALMLDLNFGLATALSTVLQHYGLLSPVLDVTDDIDTAIFFAVHRFERLADRCCYIPVGSNGGESIVYALRYDSREMEPIKEDVVIDAIPPLRPRRQSCVVVTSSPFAVNLPADYIVGAVRLRGPGPWTLPLRAEDLFPGDQEDLFLAALKTHPYALSHLTDFLPGNSAD
jgi:hypothetical protein